MAPCITIADSTCIIIQCGMSPCSKSSRIIDLQLGRVGVGLHFTTNFLPFCMYTPLGSLFPCDFITLCTIHRFRIRLIFRGNYRFLRKWPRCQISF